MESSDKFQLNNSTLFDYMTLFLNLSKLCTQQFVHVAYIEICDP